MTATQKSTTESFNSRGRSTMSDVSKVLAVIRGEISKVKIPGAYDKVYNDECMVSFDSPFSDGGLFVNMSTFLGYGVDHYLGDSSKSSCRLYVREKWTQTPISDSVATSIVETDLMQPLNPSKLAIGTDGGFVTEAKFDIIKSNQLVVVTDARPVFISLPNTELPEFISNVAEAICQHGGMKSKMQVDSWDSSNEVIISKYAASLVQLQEKGKISQHSSAWTCEMSGEKENLWLNLSTGYIGGGRKNWDGTGGSGAALQHYIDTGRLYPLCVKLGTITANSADVWSYAADEDCLVIDPSLPEHLSHWGIDIMRLEKTEKSMTEMEVELNMKYDWSRIMESGETLEPLRGAGYVGLKNIGSSCYLNSVMQTLLAVPEVQERYLGLRAQIIETGPSDPSSDFPTQLSKLAAAVLTDRYVPPEDMGMKGVEEMSGEAVPDKSQYEKYVVAPSMFKAVVGKNHREFSSSRQQDASEYYMHLLDTMSRAEKASLNKFDSAHSTSLKSKPTSSLFEFHVENKYECLTTSQVKYSKISLQTQANTMELRIPLDKATNKDEVETLQNKKKQKTEKDFDTDKEKEKEKGGEGDALTLVVPFSHCLETFFSEELLDFPNPSLGQGVSGPAKHTTRMGTFPKYLMIKLARYYTASNWVQVKVDAKVPVPEHLDLTMYRGKGIQPGEVLIPEGVTSTGQGQADVTSAATSTSVTQPGPPQVDEEVVAMLTSMGFSVNGSKRAMLATGSNDPDTAMNWMLEHMEDADFNSPIPDSSATPVSTVRGDSEELLGSISMVESMGYTNRQARAALKATDNNLERALDWIFSRDDLDQAVDEALLDGNKTANTVPSSSVAEGVDDGEGKYSLMAIISHIGRNTDHGHYVCHVKKDGQWAFFNDEKVAKSKVPPLDLGFMYLFRRNDA